MSAAVELIPGQLIHDAWRSVCLDDPAYAGDPRLDSSYDELSARYRQLCSVTSRCVGSAIGRRILSGDGFGTSFVRDTMERIYDGYNRYTFGVNARDDLRPDKADAGYAATTPPYRTLTHAAKEIDRRMVVLGLWHMLEVMPDGRLANTEQNQLRRDAAAILGRVYGGAAYDYRAGYASEASFDSII